MYSYMDVVKKIIIQSIFFFSLFLFLVPVMAADESSCEAKQAYLKEIKRLEKPLAKPRSSICFIESIPSDENLVWVDIRSKEKFSKEFVPNSLNISSSSLMSKSFLKSKPLLVLTEGFSRFKQAELCKDLLDRGFQNPKILLDGFNGLENHEVETQKLMSPAVPFGYVSATKVLAELQQGSIIFVVENKETKAQLESYSQDIIQLTSKAAHLQHEQLIEISKELTKNKLKPLVLVAEESTFKHLEEFKAPLALANLYFLQGEAEALSNQWKLNKYKPNASFVPNRYKCSGV